MGISNDTYIKYKYIDVDNNKINTLDGWQPSNVSKLKRLALSKFGIIEVKIIYNNCLTILSSLEY